MEFPMADLIALLQPRIADRESFQEFVEALEDQVPGIERDVAALRRDPSDRALIAKLFRGLHTIKGDAALCRVEVGVAICHPLESVLARCREGEIAFGSLLAEVTLLALDRLELTIEAIGAGRDVSHLNLPQLVGGLKAMAAAPAGDLAARAAAVIESVTGFKPLQAAADFPPGSMLPLPAADPAGDIWFFSELALQLEARSPLFAGRTARILRLALDTNAAAGNPVDATQLAAAIYMHDVGMMFAPESTWLKVGKLTEAERELMHEHPGQAAGLLRRMPGWAAAAEMVAQHHEMPDGKGYPEGLAGDAICAGAKIIAIVDAFEAVTLKHSERGQTRSLVRAIAEINACDNQFAAEFIEPFNRVIRRMVETG
jgi:HD-GYP domain-containing protein (c-di-GMP phosphodiesterase class II)